MKKTVAVGISATLFIGILGLALALESIANKKALYLSDGELTATGLSAPVRIVRDEKMMPYIYAQNRDDALIAQGFAMAQDRILQMHMLRSLANGRLSEFAGVKGIDSDRRARRIGFLTAASRNAMLLRAEDRRFLQKFADGVNLFLQMSKDDYPLELKLAKIEPEEWQIEDSLAIMYLMGWNSAGNYKAELLAFDLRKQLGDAAFIEIAPVFENIDNGLRTGFSLSHSEAAEYNRSWGAAWSGQDEFGRVLGAGSNAWVLGNKKTEAGFPILANDPHLEGVMLPGAFYASSIILPDNRLVGITIPGIPGIFAGRNESVAIGFTNAYGDSQDVIRYQLAPGDGKKFLDEGATEQFSIENYRIRVKDDSAKSGFTILNEETEITPEGRVFKKTDNDAFVIRWTSFEAMNSDLGLDYLFVARDVEQARERLKKITFIQLNVLMADKSGNIGWQTTGRYPLRRKGNGALPIDGSIERDNWRGWVDVTKNPASSNPKVGWIANANQMTTTTDYPDTYSTYFSPEYRYERIRNLLNAKQVFSAEDNRLMQQDVHNALAERITPVFVTALKTDAETKYLAELLSRWDFRDTRDSRAATVFHRLYQRMALLTFSDKLGEKQAKTMLQDWYFWQRPFEKLLKGESKWFDSIDTPQIETLNDLILRAAKELRHDDIAFLRLDPWGEHNIHTLDHPFGKDGGIRGHIFRGIRFHVPGSGETISRARSPFGTLGQVTTAPTLRMVVDLSDKEKVAATLNGGIVGRMGSKYLFDQAGSFYAGQTAYWWFSDAAIAEKRKGELLLRPR